MSRQEWLQTQDGVPVIDQVLWWTGLAALACLPLALLVAVMRSRREEAAEDRYYSERYQCVGED